MDDYFRESLEFTPDDDAIIVATWQRILTDEHVVALHTDDHQGGSALIWMTPDEARKLRKAIKRAIMFIERESV